MTQRYTSGAYALANPDWHASDAAHKAGALSDALRDWGIRPKTVVDVGCGTGAVLRGVHERFVEDWPETTWQGWDIAELPLPAQRGSDDIRFVCGDYVANGPACELALCVDVFEHIADDVGFLTSLFTKASCVVFRIPLDRAVWNGVRPGRMATFRNVYGHLHHYDKRQALRLLDRAGFEVEDVRYDRIPVTRHGWGRALDACRAWAASAFGDAGVWLVGGYSLIVCARARR